MKTVRKLLTAILLFTAVPVYVQAQQRLLLKTTLPFAFTVENTNLPAGSYSVFLLSDKLAMLQSADFRQVAIILFTPARGSSEAEHAKLVFYKIDGQYFLSRVWEKGSAMRREFRLGYHAKELLAKNRNQQQLAGAVEIAAH